MRTGLSLVTGSFTVVLTATVLGLAANAFRKDSLPLIRVPLSQSRPIAKRADLIANNPAANYNPKVLATKAAFSETMNPEMLLGDSSDTKAPSNPGVEPRPPTHSKSSNLTPTKSTKAPRPKKIEALFTNLKDAKSCFDNKSALFLDARAKEDFDAEHIAGALWLCFESFDEDYDKALGRISKDQLLIAYCSDEQCASAISLADELVKHGHTRVVIMLEGLPGWEDAGHPVESVVEDTKR